MITYDNVLPFDRSSNSRVSFQIYLLTDSIKSFVAFNFGSCPTDLYFSSAAGLNYNNEGIFEKFIIPKGKECLSSNVGKTGVWVLEVTSNLL